MGKVIKLFLSFSLLLSLGYTGNMTSATEVNAETTLVEEVDVEASNEEVVAEPTALEATTREMIVLPDDTDITDKFDGLFLKHLLRETNIDSNADGKFTYGEVAAVTELHVGKQLAGEEISSYEGIQYFVNANTIYLESVSSSNLDPLMNAYLPNLRGLKLKNNTKENLEMTFDFSKGNLPNLEAIFIDSMRPFYKYLNVSGLSKLEFLSASARSKQSMVAPIDAIILGENNALKFLHIGYQEHLAELPDFSQAPNLEYLNIGELPGGNVDISSLTKLIVFWSDSRSATSYDFSKNVNLEVINIASNTSLTSVDVTMLPNLKGLFLYDSPLISEIDLSNATQLARIEVSSTQIKSLDLSAMPAYPNVGDPIYPASGNYGPTYTWQWQASETASTNMMIEHVDKVAMSIGINGYYHGDTWVREELILPENFSGEINLRNSRLEEISGGSILHLTKHSLSKLSGQKPYKTVKVNDNNQAYIVLADGAVPDETTIGLGGVYDSATQTITWPEGTTIAEVIESQNEVIAFSNIIWTNTTTAKDFAFTGVYTLIEGPAIIEATASVGGVISPSGEVEVQKGEDAVFTFTPDEGYEISQILVDGVEVTIEDTYTFSAVDTAHTIEVSFAKKQYTLTASAGEGGSISSDGETTVEHGAEMVYTITPDAGYEVSQILVDGVEVTIEDTYTFSAVDAAHTIEVSFVKQKFAITVTAPTEGGTLSEDGEVEVEYGSDLTITITPEEGYKVSQILVDGTEVEVAEEYTFTAIDAAHTIEVVFELKTYSIEVYSTEFGTVSLETGTIAFSPFAMFDKGLRQHTLDATHELTHGEELVLISTPDEGYYVESIYINDIEYAVDKEEAGVQLMHVFTEIQEDLNILVVFVQDETVEEVITTHVVNFTDCQGNLVSQGWPQDGEDVTGPSGYAYDSSELKNITFSKDVKPTNCASGFLIPNTGR